jgi:hypothetical protein
MTLLAFLGFTACGGGLTDAQLSWCLDRSPNGTIEEVAYPEGIWSDGMVEGVRRQRVWESNWRAENPGEPLPTRTVPDESSSNTWAVWTVAVNLRIANVDFVDFVPQPGEAPSSEFVRACKAAYENR